MCERFVNSFTDNIIEKLKNPLKLYLVRIPLNLTVSHGLCTEFITAAYSEEEARKTKPYYFWISEEMIDKLLVTEIGYASENVAPGVIIKYISC